MAIIGALPNIISDGQIIDAVPVMNDFNWIVSQVNANAQALSVSTLSEWTLLGQTPTYISATSFSIPGNVTATFAPDLRIWTVNTAGNVYSSVIASSFGAGITTITVVNDGASILDTGLSAVNISIQNPVNLSQPARSVVSIVQSISNQSLASATTYTIGENLNPTKIVDTLSEFNTATGIFTAVQAGTYRILCQAIWENFITTGSAGGQINIFKNGSGYGQLNIPLIYYIGASDQNNQINGNLEVIAQLAAGGTLKATWLTPTFTVGTLQTNVELHTPYLIIQRIA